MALIIRLRQQGRKNNQTYRLVVMDRKAPRDGKYIEKLGWYNPTEKEEKELHIEAERVLFWLDNGALISEKAKSLVARKAPTAIKSYSERKQKKRAKARATRVKAKAKK